MGQSSCPPPPRFWTILHFRGRQLKRYCSVIFLTRRSETTTQAFRKKQPPSKSHRQAPRPHPEPQTPPQAEELSWRYTYCSDSPDIVDRPQKQFCTTHWWCRGTRSEPSDPTPCPAPADGPCFEESGEPPPPTPTPLHLAEPKPGAALVGSQVSLQETQNTLNTSFKRNKTSRRGWHVGAEALWQVMAGDKAKVPLLVQRVCCPSPDTLTANHQQL